MKQGQIAAGMTTEPTIARMLKTGEAKILVDMRTPETTVAALGGPYPAASLYMATTWVDGHQAETQKLANALEIGSASGWERGCSTVYVIALPGDIKKKNTK